ncbi:papain family cysteine protease [Oesophagostomum dentatum]|uniref:Papain family cysteine protease n=1 Tax=Oesophagostomum dentatum TaxID=61180 RepID=A0A0B1TTB0_OESDE|nr:papain family cysteine protease [Oesophagostomum dentatum]
MALLLTILAAACIAAVAEEPQLEGQELVDYLNSKQSLFKAGLPKMSEEQFKSRLMDLSYLEYEREYAEVESNPDEIPESFDSRKQWPECKSISIIRDQANCGSCWAVSAASAMSDKLCIQSKGVVTSLISDTDLLSCCGTFCGYGCSGGYTTKAWQYAVNSGICTGGAYRQKGVCKPYSFHPCGKHANQTYYGECKGTEKTPECRRICQLGYPKKYQEDKFYASSSYDLTGEATIQKEIIKNGPVQAGFVVYEDFRYYTKGIYKHSWGAQLGGHAIKIIGWGVENGTKYWTISNSWNSDWGENGYFRMIRGINDCRLESWVSTGIMKA